MQRESFRFVIFDSLRLRTKSDPGDEKFIHNENSQKIEFSQILSLKISFCVKFYGGSNCLQHS